MKLINNRYQQFFDFDKNPCNLLVVENSKEYFKVLKELHNETNGKEDSDFMLSDNGKTLKLSKVALFIYEFLDLDINNKKIANEICRRVAEILTEKDYSEDFCKINQLLIKINDDLIQNFDFVVNYDSDMDFEKFIKLSNYQIGEEASLLEKLSSYIKIFITLKKCNLVIFAGLFELLSKEEIDLLIKQLAYNEINCLFVEPTLKYNIDNLGKIIIDKDLCEI